MLSLDISRNSFQRPKNFTGMRWQQGRIPLDSEMNEGVDLAADELHRAIKDVICNSGTPDDGFLLSNVTVTENAVNFDIARGTYYIGGLRYDMLEGSSFLTQPDWLQISLDLAPPPAPPPNDAGGAPRFDFVWLDAWEQLVSATEDSELFERALASGADSAGRMRRMARVRYTADSAETCPEALAAERGDRTLDPVTCGLETGAGLTVGFNDEGVEEDLCAPQTQEGYLGADNELFRVQITAPDRFIYGRNEALYRVQIEAVDPPVGAPPGTPGQTLVTFLTQPRDVVSQPLAGQTAELFRWNTRLPNGEKLAEPIGLLANIATDYDPETGSILLDWELDTDWLDWFTGVGAGTENPMDAPERASYFYLRVWTGGSGDAAAPDHQIVPGAILLAGTGLEVTFAPANTPGTFGEAGQAWIIAARPNAPDVVTPWRLMDESAETAPPAPPMTPLRHMAPLAIIRWDPDASGTYQPTVIDCRERFRKLCQVHTCCEITVGDGTHSFGDVNSIPEAVARLPLEGGRICLMRGVHTASVDLTGRTDIHFTGCGPETLWLADESQLAIPAAVLMSDSHRIRFSGVEMEASSYDVALAGERLGETLSDARCSAITFERMALRGREASVLWLNGCDELVIERCEISQLELGTPRTIDAEAGTDPAIFALGDDIRIERCRIEVDLAIPAELSPLSGIQIGGTSTDARILECDILGGKGNGITLGHLEWIEEDTGGFTGIWTTGPGFFVNDAGCLEPGFIPIPPRGDDDVPDRLIPVSGGEIRHLQIAGNFIADMGLSGISVAHFFDLETNPEFISVADVRITENEITRCLRTDLATAPLELRYFLGHGGIALAACDLIEIDRNAIHANGATVTAPNAGVFLLHTAGCAMRENRIYDNGATPGTSGILDPGRRGGVIIGWAVTYANPPATATDRAVPPRIAALEFSGNFVDSTHGRALKVTALGPVRACDNRLVGAGAVEPELALIGFLLTLLPPITGILGILAALLAQAPVASRNLASDNLIIGELLASALGGNAVSIFNLAFLEELAGLADDGPNEASDLAVGGETMFDNNQVGFRPHSLEATSQVSAVLLASLDDVSCSNNQIECDTGLSFVLSNTFVLGSTVRMIGNRLQEQLIRTLFSGYTHGLFLNSTATNQGTHCFAVTTLLSPSTATNRINRDNTSLIDALIPTSPNVDNTFCGIIEDFIQEQIGFGTNTDGIAPNIAMTISREDGVEFPNRQSWGAYSFVADARTGASREG